MVRFEASRPEVPEECGMDRSRDETAPSAMMCKLRCLFWGWPMRRSEVFRPPKTLQEHRLRRE